MSHPEPTPLAPRSAEPGDHPQYSAKFAESSEKYLETIDRLNEQLSECLYTMANDPEQQDAMRAEIAKLDEERSAAFKKLNDDSIEAFREYTSALASYRAALLIDTAGREVEEPTAGDPVELEPLADISLKKKGDLEKRSTLNEDLLNALKSSKTPADRAAAVNKANEEAHGQYRAKQAESSATYRETMDRLNKEHQDCCDIMVKDPGQYQAMMAKIGELDKERDAAYKKMGNDSSKAFKEYAGACEGNHAALKDYNTGMEAGAKSTASYSAKLSPLPDSDSARHTPEPDSAPKRR